MILALYYILSLPWNELSFLKDLHKFNKEQQDYSSDKYLWHAYDR